MKYCFGIDVGGTTVKCGLFTEEGELLDKWEIPTNKENSGGMIPQEIANTVKEKIQEKSLQREDILGLGIGLPGPVDSKGIVNGCANLGWGVLNIVEIMQTLTGFRVLAGNDANVAALGEMWMGGAKGFDNIVMITLGTGVGGGIIVDGKMIAGSIGAGGEIGHMLINSEETAVCGCGGRGHLEQYTSATGVVRLAKQLLIETEMPSMLRGVMNFTAKDVFDSAKENDELALAVVDLFGQYLAQGLGLIAAVVDPEVFVIGGGMARAGGIIIDVVKRYYNRNLFPPIRDKKFCFAELGNDAGIYGCAKLLIG